MQLMSSLRLSWRLRRHLPVHVMADEAPCPCIIGLNVWIAGCELFCLTMVVRISEEHNPLCVAALVAPFCIGSELWRQCLGNLVHCRPQKGRAI